MLEELKQVTMATGFSLKSPFRYNARSVSLQPRSHPSTIKIEEELNKIRALEASSSSVPPNRAELCRNIFENLESLYISIEDLLKLPLTQQALSQQRQNQVWVINDLLDDTLKHLEICSNTKEAVQLMQESVRELQSALRRSRGDEMSIETDIEGYFDSRKKLKKEISQSLITLKEMDKRVIMGMMPLIGLDNNIGAIVRVLREASLVTGSTFQSLLTYLSVPVLKRQRPSKWVLVSKLVSKRALSSGQQGRMMNELEGADMAINKIFLECSRQVSWKVKIQSLYGRLEALNVSFEMVESGLECLFRHLIQTRVLLLNALSY